MTTQEPITQKKSKMRSPSYPAIDLETAIARARDLYGKENMNSAARDVILSHWGYTKGSSNGLVILAALIKYGLLADEGSGDKRKARLTELARKIILDDRPNSPERDAAIREAALNPTIHKEFWSTYKGLLPSDDNLRYELRVNRKFTESAIANFIQELRSTWAFTKLAEYGSMSEEGKDKTSPESEVETMTTQTATPTESKVEVKPSAGSTIISGSKAVKYCWPLSKNIMADVVITGTDIDASHLEMLRKYLDLAKSALEPDKTK